MFYELLEYIIPETKFTLRLYAEEDERTQEVGIVSVETSYIIKSESGEECYDIYLVRRGGDFPQFEF